MGNKPATAYPSTSHPIAESPVLYKTCAWSESEIKRMVDKGKIGPRYVGVEASQIELEDCPICFLGYPSLNRCLCCRKYICTECLLQVFRPDNLSSAICPFCKSQPFRTHYRGPRSVEEKHTERLEEAAVNQALARAKEEEELQSQIRKMNRLQQQQQQQEEQRQQQQSQQPQQPQQLNQTQSHPDEDEDESTAHIATPAAAATPPSHARWSIELDEILSNSHQHNDDDLESLLLATAIRNSLISQMPNVPAPPTTSAAPAAPAAPATPASPSVVSPQSPTQDMFANNNVLPFASSLTPPISATSSTTATTSTTSEPASSATTFPVIPRIAAPPDIPRRRPHRIPRNFDTDLLEEELLRIAIAMSLEDSQNQNNHITTPAASSSPPPPPIPVHTQPTSPLSRDETFVVEFPDFDEIGFAVDDGQPSDIREYSIDHEPEPRPMLEAVRPAIEDFSEIEAMPETIPEMTHHMTSIDEVTDVSTTIHTPLPFDILTTPAQLTILEEPTCFVEEEGASSSNVLILDESEPTKASIAHRSRVVVETDAISSKSIDTHNGNEEDSDFDSTVAEVNQSPVPSEVWRP
eukprot:c102_g1_i1.p1 GENE.c102_g1_i1~~c102_g1_i1.p1  ORF type:complete len:580 (+),score=145.65 c102_g1_i1:70-1809(+)